MHMHIRMHKRDIRRKNCVLCRHGNRDFFNANPTKKFRHFPGASALLRQFLPNGQKFL